MAESLTVLQFSSSAPVGLRFEGRVIVGVKRKSQASKAGVKEGWEIAKIGSESVHPLATTAIVTGYLKKSAMGAKKIVISFLTDKTSRTSINSISIASFASFNGSEASEIKPQELKTKGLKRNDYYSSGSSLLSPITQRNRSSTFPGRPGSSHSRPGTATSNSSSTTLRGTRSPRRLLRKAFTPKASTKQRRLSTASTISHSSVTSRGTRGTRSVRNGRTTKSSWGSTSRFGGPGSIYTSSLSDNIGLSHSKIRSNGVSIKSRHGKGVFDLEAQGVGCGLAHGDFEGGIWWGKCGCCNEDVKKCGCAPEKRQWQRKPLSPRSRTPKVGSKFSSTPRKEKHKRSRSNTGPLTEKDRLATLKAAREAASRKSREKFAKKRAEAEAKLRVKKEREKARREAIKTVQAAVSAHIAKISLEEKLYRIQTATEQSVVPHLLAVLAVSKTREVIRKRREKAARTIQATILAREARDSAHQLIEEKIRCTGVVQAYFLSFLAKKRLKEKVLQKRTEASKILQVTVIAILRQRKTAERVRKRVEATKAIQCAFLAKSSKERLMHEIRRRRATIAIQAHFRSILGTYWRLKEKSKHIRTIQAALMGTVAQKIAKASLERRIEASVALQAYAQMVLTMEKLQKEIRRKEAKRQLEEKMRREEKERQDRAWTSVKRSVITTTQRKSAKGKMISVSTKIIIDPIKRQKLVITTTTTTTIDRKSGRKTVTTKTETVTTTLEYPPSYRSRSGSRPVTPKGRVSPRGYRTRNGLRSEGKKKGRELDGRNLRGHEKWKPKGGKWSTSKRFG